MRKAGKAIEILNYRIVDKLQKNKHGGNIGVILEGFFCQEQVWKEFK